jgi:chromosome segregation ATPase
MKDRVERIEVKVDEIKESIASIDKTLAINTESLITHIKRTDLLEKKLEKVEESIIPVKAHLERVNGVLKFILYLASVSVIAKFFIK